MFAILLGNTVVFLILLGNGFSTPVIESDKSDNKGLRYEEYVVEHEISREQARNSTLSADIQSIVPPPGCQQCTKDETKYCLGSDLINDHCCCDRRHHEFLPFIPHTCYTGSQLCVPILTCEEYSRLRTCCCDKLVLEKWKEKFKNSACTVTSGIAFILVLSRIVYIFVNYFMV